MNFYFFNFLFFFLQVEPHEEVIQTYYTLKTIAWILIVCTILVFFLFGYLFYGNLKKRGKKLTFKKLGKGRKINY